MKNEAWVAKGGVGGQGTSGGVVGRQGWVGEGVGTRAGPRGGDYEGWVARGGFKIGKIRGLGCKK